MSKNRRIHTPCSCRLVFAIVATASLQALGLDPGHPPGDNFDLTHWYLGLPVDSSGGTSGDSASISAASLVAGYTNALYFYTGSDGAMVFWAPVDGATTSGSSYPRSELREQIVPGNNNINWAGYGTHILDAQCKVTQMPSTEKVIIGQIHSKTGLARPLVKLLYDGSKNPNRVRALIKEDADDPDNNSDVNYDFPNVPLNGTIDYNIKMQDGLVTITVNGTTHTRDVFSVSPSWENEEFYFKAGSYCQDNTGDSSEGSRVDFYSLTASHSYGNQYDLTVASPYGTPVPAIGTTAYDDGTLINASVPDSPVVSGTTRHLVTGWSGTGDVSGGSGTSTSFSLTQDSSITWLWQTQYWLDTEANSGGAVTIADEWYNAGAGVTIAAVPDPGHHFVNWTGAGGSTHPVLDLTMDAPKAVTANFAVDPLLRITAAGDEVVLSWPTEGNVGFDLESVASITSTVWSAAGAPTVVGDHYVVTNSAVGSGAYFRLRRP